MLKLWAYLLVLMVAFAALAGCSKPSASPAPLQAIVVTATSTAEPTPTEVATTAFVVVTATPTPMVMTATRTPIVVTATPEVIVVVPPTPQVVVVTATPTATPYPSPTPEPTPTSRYTSQGRVLEATATPILAPKLESTPTATPTPIPTATSTPSPTATPTPIPTATPRPAVNTIEGAKLLALDLINEERVSRGLYPVTFGTSQVAQEHAENMLASCYLSHWSLRGLKPYIRYSELGGYQANGENISGQQRCYGSSYREWTLEDAVRAYTDDLLTSPGHLKNIVNPLHRKVNIGLAHRGANFWLVQHFEGDYVHYDVLPSITEGTLILRAEGSLKNGAVLDPNAAPQLYYDPPALTFAPEELKTTECYSYNSEIGAFRPPLDPNSSYSHDPLVRSVGACYDPHTERAKNLPTSVANPRWITARKLRHDSKSFILEARLNGRPQDYANGYYTLVLWGITPSGSGVISEYSILVDWLE